MAEGRPSCKDVGFKSSGIKVPCQPCSKKNIQKDAVIYCSDCDEAQCSICAKEHDTYLVMGRHVTVDINEWRKSNEFFELANISKCKTHGLSYEFYCEYDGKLCCRQCIDGLHHSCRSIVKISAMDHKILETETGSVLSNIGKLLDKVDRISSQADDTKVNIKSQVATLPRNIDSMRRKVLEMFNQFEEKIKEEAKVYEAVNLNTLDQIKRHTSEVTGDIQNTLTNVECLPTTMTPSQHFIFEKEMDNILKNYNREIQKQVTNLRSLENDLSVHFSDKLKDFVTSLPNEIGSLQTDENEQGSDHVPDPNAVGFRHVTAVNPRSQHKHLYASYTGMDFLQNDRLVLADSTNKKCVVMNTSLKIIGEQRLKYKPQSLLVFGKDELLISSGKHEFIDYFEVNSDNILIHKKRINTMAPCDSLSVINNKTFAVGIANGSRPVCKLTDFSHFSSFDFEFERDRYKLWETKCVYCPRLDMLVLTDKVTDTIWLINTITGEKIQVKDKAIKGPRCAAIGKDESIFVCCEGTCCLVQLSPYGEILSVRKLKMSFPYSLCISKDKSKLAVSNKSIDDCKVQIFTLI